MKIVINLELKYNYIQLDYRRLIVSYIKSAISSYDTDLYKKLYLNNTLQKNFAFDVRLIKPTFEREKITLENNQIILTIITNDAVLGIDLYNSFVSLKNKEYPLADNNSMKSTKVMILNHRYIDSDEVTIVMHTPLVVRQHTKGEKDIYYRYNDKNFNQTFNQCIKYQLQHINNMAYREDVIVDLQPIKPRDAVIKTFGLSIPCSIGTYKLKADKYIINQLYQTGMCSRRSEGFGVFEIII